MLEQWMGRDKFFAGISQYLNKYQYDNAETDDLWEMLGEVNHTYNIILIIGLLENMSPVVLLNINQFFISCKIHQV